MPKVAKWRQISTEDFEKIVKESRSFQDLANRLGYEKTGGNIQTTLKQVVKERNIDTSHFLGQGWNKNNYDYSSFAKNSIKKNGKTFAAPLIKLRGHKCECCGNTTWLGNPIKLEVHHKNGDRSDNSLENLELLCPNCHAYTDTFCYKTKCSTVEEKDFVLALQHSANIKKALELLGLTPAGGNYARARELIEKYEITNLYSK